MQELGAGVGEVRELLAGVIRDVLLNRVPVILRKEIYAIAASIEVLAKRWDWSRVWLSWLAILVCLARQGGKNRWASFVPCLLFMCAEFLL